MIINKIEKRSLKSMRKKRISLTFDDGPDAVYTPRILDILDGFGIKATFFIVGARAERYPQLLKRIYREGHDVGNHTYSHPVSPLLKVKKKGFIKKEIVRTNRVIESIIGRRPLLFRPSLAPWDRASKILIKQATEIGHLPVGWSFSTLDWLGTSFIIKRRFFQYPKQDGDIILLHDGAEKTLIKKRKATVDMLPIIIKNCRRNSLQLSPLTSLLE